MVVCQRRDLGRRDARPPAAQPEATAGSARIFARARLKRRCQGQCNGARSMGVPARLTRRAGMQMSCARSGGGHGELVVGMYFAGQDGPAAQVVGEDGAGQPGTVGGEAPRWAVLETGAFFDVPDGELDSGMFAVEAVYVDGWAVQVGEEAVVAPIQGKGPVGRGRSAGCGAR